MNLLRDWNEVTKTTNGAIDGDAVRRVVGTVGVSSPLFQHEKVLKTVGKSLDERDMIDIVDFTEATDDLVANLREVDFGVLCHLQRPKWQRWPRKGKQRRIS